MDQAIFDSTISQSSTALFRTAVAVSKIKWANILTQNKFFMLS